MNRRPEEALKLRDIDQDVEVCGGCRVNKRTDRVVSTLGIISKGAETSEWLEILKQNATGISLTTSRQCRSETRLGLGLA